MGRGRHTSSRGRGSDPEWTGAHWDPGWHDDERGTQEWLNDANWLDDPEPPEPAEPSPPAHGLPPNRHESPGSEKRSSRRRSSRPRFRGRRLVALSAVAVVMAIGTAAIGVKLSSTQLNLTRTPDCPKGQACAAIAPVTPPGGAVSSGTPHSGGRTTAAPSDSESMSPSESTSPSDSTSPNESTSPSESTSGSASTQARPSAAAGRTPERRSPVASAPPTPDRTPDMPTPKPSRTVRDTPTPDATPDPTPDPTPNDTESASPDPTPQPDKRAPLVSRGRVAVDFGVSDVTGTGYTGRLTITNSGAALDGWSVRVPVGGHVTAVDGADWTQEGDILVLTSTNALGENEQAVISFSADGDSTVPDSCELNGGSCRIRATESAASQVEPKPMTRAHPTGAETGKSRAPYRRLSLFGPDHPAGP
ncbi:MAG: glycoside hydrolase family 48 [Sphaerisporangium sp.]|nr:glycoside hydrolase family 48 [Sphaerisporangium sp.]